MVRLDRMALAIFALERFDILRTLIVVLSAALAAGFVCLEGRYELDETAPYPRRRPGLLFVMLHLRTPIFVAAIRAVLLDYWGCRKWAWLFYASDPLRQNLR